MIELRIPEALELSLTDYAPWVELSEGQTISMPLAWYPRLAHAIQDESDNCKLIAEGQGIVTQPPASCHG